MAQEDENRVLGDEVKNGYTQVKTDYMQDGKEYMHVAMEQNWVENWVEEEDDEGEEEQTLKDVDWAKNDYDYLKDEGVVPRIQDYYKKKKMKDKVKDEIKAIDYMRENEG